MADEGLMSNAFQVFMTEAPAHAQAWMSGVPFHVAQAKEAGASREEVVSAVLIGLPAVGNIVTRSLPAAIRAYDSRPG